MLKHYYCRGRSQLLSTELAIISGWVAVFIPGHLVGWLVERSYSVLLLGIAIASLAISHCTSTSAPNFLARRNKTILFGLFIITTLYIISAIVTAVSSSYITTIRDVLDLSRYMVVAAIFIIFGNADPDRLRTSVERLILVSLSFSLLVLIVYLVDVPLLSNFIGWLYEDTKTAISFPRWVRLAAPFENPNYLAFYAVLCFAYSLFFLRGKHRYILVSLSLVILLSTGSRTGWVSAVVLIAGLILRVLFSIFNMKRSILRQDVQFLACLVVATSLLLWFFYPYLIDSARIQMVISAFESGGISNEPNVAGRIDMVLAAVKALIERPMLGWGPLKAGYLEVIDSQYFLVLSRQGFVGFILIMIIFLYVFSGAVKFASTREEKFGVYFMWLAVAVMLIAGAFLNNFRLLVLFIFFVIATTGRLKMNKEGKDVVRYPPQNLLSTK